MLINFTLTIIYILDLFLMFFTPVYTFWNWRLALHGATQVEHTKKLFRFRDKADKCMEIVGGGTRDRMHGIKGITTDDSIVRAKSLRNRAKGRRNINAIKSRANLSTAASTSAEYSNLNMSDSSLNMSDIESDDSFECEDELIIDDEPVIEEDEESIIVSPQQEQTLENVLEMHDQQLAQFIRTYRIQSWRENVFIIFGTWSLLKAIAFPLDR